jgi:uncharacterized protein (DUF1800 family)
MATERERISHVVRRLGVGANPDLAGTAPDVAAAIATSLDLSGPPVEMPEYRPPRDEDDEGPDIEEAVSWWIDTMVASHQPIVERLTWFWHDHFATSQEKVENTYLMQQQQATIRRHATGNFGDLLKAISRDAAMLIYLDGEQNTTEALNENFGREVMELYTMGVGNYAQEDVVAAARAFTGWMVAYPDYEEDYPELGEVEPWTAALIGEYHDRGQKTLLGSTGRFGMDDALDLMLSHPATGPFIAGKLYRELVGVAPDPPIEQRLGAAFAKDYEIMPLVEAIVAEPAFTSDDAIRARVRTPLEKLVTLLQAFPLDEQFEIDWALWWLELLGYVPYGPPNPAGYPSGQRLLSPGHLAGSFMLLNALAEPGRRSAGELFARLGVFDVSRRSWDVVSRQINGGMALALAYGSPEFALT